LRFAIAETNSARVGCVFASSESKRERASAANGASPIQGHAERLDLDFLAHPKLSNSCERFAVGAYFRYIFLPFGVGL